MKPIYHGIEYNKTDNGGVFRLGILRMFNAIVINYRFPFSSVPKVPAWPNQWFDRKFDSGVKKFQDTFWKIDQVAGLVTECKDTITAHKDSRHIEEAAKVQRGIMLLPIYLDCILMYTHVLSECIANITPNLCGEKGLKANIASSSFRKHRKWFTETCTSFDPEYTTILLNQTKWFDVLAGETHGDGLRTKVIHHRGLYQISYTADTPPNKTEVFASMVGDSGFICNNVLPLLQKIFCEFFIFLDSYAKHFNMVIHKQIGTLIIDLENKSHTNFYSFGTSKLKSSWLFPEIA